MSQNYKQGNDGHYYISGGGQPSNVPQNMQSMNQRHSQQQQQQQHQAGLYQGQIPVSNAHELKQLQGMAPNYAMYRPQLTQAFPNTAMMVNPIQNHQRQNFIAAGGNMQQMGAFYFPNPSFSPYGLAQRAPNPFRATQPQQMHYTFQTMPQNVYAFQHPQMQHRHTIPQQMQAAQIQGAPNGINNIQAENIAIGAPIITNQPPPPPAQTPTQPIPVQSTPPVTIPATVAPPIEKKGKKILTIIDPQTKEDVLENFIKTKKQEKTTESLIPTISAPAPEYLINHGAGGPIGLPPHLPPLLFEGKHKHYGNDPIWTPEQHLQQTTPVVSANVDGPSVVPKQIPKKIPKTVNVPTTSPPLQTTTYTATPQIPVSITMAPEEPEQSLEIVEEINDNICVEVQEDEELEYIEDESPVEMNQETTPIETDIDEITEGIEEMSVEAATTTITSEFIVNNTDDDVPVNQAEVVEETYEEVENNEPEEVIAEFANDTAPQQQLSSSEITAEKGVDNENSKQNTVEKQPKFHGPIDETDRVMPVQISQRPEHVQKEFKLVMEKYQGLFPNPKNLDYKTIDAVIDEGIAEYIRVMGIKQPPEKQYPESEDDDADKENNIQNKKCLQEASSLKPAIEYHKEQWSPSNPGGKKYYTVEQLLQLGKQVAANGKSNLKINPSIQNALVPTKTFQVDTFLQKHRTNNQSKFNLNRPSQGGNRGMHPMNQKMMGMQNQKQQSDTIKISLSLHEDVKLKETPNAWKPKHLLIDHSLTEDDRVLRDLTDNFRCVLNKLTPENFAVLLKEVKQYQITKYEHLHSCIQLIFEKAIAEPNFSVTYAEMCKQLSTICVNGGDGNTKQQFKNCLINQCQTEFENAHRIKSSKDRTDLLDQELDPVKKEELRENLEEEDYRMRKRAVGTVRFIGELYKIDLLTIKIMHTCVNLLLDPRTMDEESLECLCKLLTTVGKKMETDTRDCLSEYFQHLQDIIGKKSEHKISSRIRFMIIDLIDLRHTRWVSRRNDQNPKTMGQIQKELETEQRNIQLMNYNQGPDNMGHNQQGGRNRYDRGGRGGPQMNYKPEKLSFDSKKMDFSRLGNMETETKLGHAGFFQQWNTPGANKFQNDDEPDRDRGHHQQMPPPGFHHNPQHHYHQQMGERGGNGPPSLPMMHPFGNNNKQRGGGGDKDMYRARGSNEYRRDYRDNSNHHDNNRYRGGGNDSLSRSSSFNRNLGPPPGIMQHQQHTSSSTLSSRLSSSSGRGSVDSHSNSDRRRSNEEKVECAHPSNEKRESLRKVFEGIFHDYMTSRENKYAIEDLHTIERQYRWAAIYECALKALNHKPDERAWLAKLCAVYIHDGNETLTVPELIKVFGTLCDDAGVGLSYLAEYLSPLLKDGILRIHDLLVIGETCIRKSKGHELLLAVLQNLNQNYQSEVVRDLWCQSGLSWQQFMPHLDTDQLVKFIQANALLNALDKVSSNSSSSSSSNNNVKVDKYGNVVGQRHDWEYIERSIFQFCSREHPDDIRLRQYIDDWLAKCNTHMDDSNFIRAFTAAIVRHCIDEKPDTKTLNDKRFVPIKESLKFYVYNKTSREIESLTAIQRVVDSIDYPKSLLQNIFSQLYVETVISRKGFLTWYHNKDISNRNGVAKMSINKWIKDISREGSDHSSGEENN